MTIYLKVENNVVTNSIIADQEFINAGYAGNPLLWVENNVAGIGWIYSELLHKLIPLQPYLSWTFNNDINQWESPIPYPADDKNYEWDEQTQSWKEQV